MIKQAACFPAVNTAQSQHVSANLVFEADEYDFLLFTASVDSERSNTTQTGVVSYELPVGDTLMTIPTLSTTVHEEGQQETWKYNPQTK